MEIKNAPTGNSPELEVNTRKLLSRKMFAKTRHPLPVQQKFANMKYRKLVLAISLVTMRLVVSQIVIGAFVFGPSNALAQTTAVCSNTPNTGERIECTESADSTTTIDIDLEGYIVDTTEVGEHGIYAKHEGDEDIEISLEPHIDLPNQTITTNDISTAGQNAHGIFGHHKGDGDITMTLKNLDIDNLFSAGNDELGIHGLHEGTGDITINADAVDIETQGQRGYGIYSWHTGSAGDLKTYVRDSTITTMGQYANGIFSVIRSSGTGDIYVEFKKIDSQSRPTIYTKGPAANGIRAVNQGAGEGETRVVVNNAKIDTEGSEAHGVDAWRDGAEGGYGKVYIDISDSEITTKGYNGLTIFGRTSASTVPGYENDLIIKVQGSTLITNGILARGVFANSQTSGLLHIDLDNVTIKTTATELYQESYTSSHGVFAYKSTNNTGHILVETTGGEIITQGKLSYGIFALQTGTDGGVNDIDVTTTNTDITTHGEGAVGIYARHRNGAGAMRVHILSGNIRTHGENASAIQFGRFSGGAMSEVADVGEDGYRKHTATVNGQVFGGTGDAAGVYLWGGGKVFIGPNGTLGADSGVAIRATGDTANPMPKLYVDINLNGRQVTDVIGDDYIINDGGETTLLINGIMLHDGATGNTGFTAANGMWDVMLRDDGHTVDTSTEQWTVSARSTSIVADRDFSADDFNEEESTHVLEEIYAPRAALYEILPDFLLRLTSPCSLPPDSTTWVRSSGGSGSYYPERSTIGSKYRLNHIEVDAGRNVSLGEEIKGWISGRYVRGSADVSSPTGGGILDAEEIGASIGARWQNANNYYAAGCFSLSDYNIDISSDTRGRLKSGVGGNGNFLTFEAGRRIAFGKTAHLTPRAWLARSEVSMDKFTDAVDSRVSFSDSERLTGGVGMMAETTRTWGDRELSLQGSLGIERIFRGAQTVSHISGEDLRMKSAKDSAILAISGVYHRGSYSLSAAISAREGSNSDGRDYSGSLNWEMRF